MPLDCKYYIIALIIVIFLICIFYPPFDTSGCESGVKTPDPEIRESFVPWDLATPDDIRTTAEAAARKLSELTYNLVVYPCEQISTANDISTCISGYKQYYENIIKEPVADMYIAIKELDGQPHYRHLAFTADIDEEYEFTIEMTNAYSKALSSAVDYVQTNYGFEGFDQNIFIQVFQEFLTKLMSQGVVNIYTGRHTTGDRYQTQPIQPSDKQKDNVTTLGIPSKETEKLIQQSVMEEIAHDYNMIENQDSDNHNVDAMYLDCDNIRNDKTRIFIDGMRLTCN